MSHINDARREVARCQKALDAGSPPKFWEARLTTAAKNLEAAALILRMQIAAMHDYADPATGCTGTYSADCPACIARKVRENKP